MNFDDWKEEQERIHNDYDAENAWYAGAQSRQAEIDELQARADEALNTLCKLQYSSGERIYGEVGDILKGKQND